MEISADHDPRLKRALQEARQENVIGDHKPSKEGIPAWELERAEKALLEAKEVASYYEDKVRTAQAAVEAAKVKLEPEEAPKEVSRKRGRPRKTEAVSS